MRHKFMTQAEERAIAEARRTIGDAMERSGMGRSELAQRAGLTRQRISQIFSAHDAPTLRSLARIADALGYELRVELRPRK